MKTNQRPPVRADLPARGPARCVARLPFGLRLRRPARWLACLPVLLVGALLAGCPTAGRALDVVSGPRAAPSAAAPAETPAEEPAPVPHGAKVLRSDRAVSPNPRAAAAAAAAPVPVIVPDIRVSVTPTGGVTAGAGAPGGANAGSGAPSGANAGPGGASVGASVGASAGSGASDGASTSSGTPGARVSRPAPAHP